MPWVMQNIPVSYISGNVDMEKAKIEEYYESPVPSNIGIGNLMYADGNYAFGVDETAVNALGNVTATGKLNQTIIAYDERNTAMDTEISVDEEFIKSANFDFGALKNKFLYNTPTRLANFETIEKLAPYLIEGSFNQEKIQNGEEIIFVRRMNKDYVKVGDVIEIASIIPNENFAPKEIITKKVKIGAVVNGMIIPEKEALLQPIFADPMTQFVENFYLLTTQTGAENIGLHNSVYTQIYAPEPVNGSLIPPTSAMKSTLLADLKHQKFVEKATEYGGLALIIILMSLLGFSAYFSGIGMKINQKSYQISVLRALGMNKKKIQRRFFFDNLKIPVIAGIITYGLVILVQKYVKHGYELLVKLNEPDENGMTTFDENSTKKATELVDKYLLNNRLWTVPIEKPLLIIFGIMCLVTIILTFISLRKFKGNIADNLNSGRER
jgi:putative ABC transport system permease protein